MTLQLIPFAMSVAGAVVLIIALLLVAAAIGYVTAWFYAKSVYTPVIKKLEEEKSDLQGQVSGLKDDILRLDREISDLKAKADELEKTVAEKDTIIKELKKKPKEKQNPSLNL